jgi:hypothetical protein
MSRLQMTDSPRIPYALWPLAVVFAFVLACIVNVIERNWHRPQQSRSADWRRTAG